MKVLIADDDPVSRRFLQVTLGNAGYETVMVTEGAQALAALGQADSPKLVILDWIMPQLDGIEVCREIRKRPLESYRYIILLTVKGRQREIIEGLEAGADDYVTKPFDLMELKARLRVGRRILDLQDQLIASREDLRFEATHDTQTALLNHGAILEVLDKEVLRARREGTPLGVLMLDLDHFKSINDRYGHMAGDTVLREIAKRIQLCTRPYDSVGRYGGEEFLVVAPGCDLENAKLLAERLRAAVSNEPINDAVVSILVTASLGVSAALGGKESEQVLRATDEALYSAKIQGRNRVVASVESESIVSG